MSGSAGIGRPYGGGLPDPGEPPSYAGLPEPAEEVAWSAPWTERTAALGPFFAVASHDQGDGREDGQDVEGDLQGAPGGAPWRSMAELTSGGAALGDRVAAVRGLLAAGGGQAAEAVELRVAASVTHLGLVARVLSPHLAAALLYGWAPDRPRLAELRWQPVLGRPFPLSLPRAAASPPHDGKAPHTGQGTASPAGQATLADALAAGLLAGPVAELARPFGAMGVSPHILRGNTASAVNGAAAMAATADPALAARARALAALLLERPPLRGAAGHTAAGAFRRRSCCLIYRAAPGGAGALCGDCVLRRTAD